MNTEKLNVIEETVEEAAPALVQVSNSSNAGKVGKFLLITGGVAAATVFAVKGIKKLFRKKAEKNNAAESVEKDSENSETENTVCM